MRCSSAKSRQTTSAASLVGGASLHEGHDARAGQLAPLPLLHHSAQGICRALPLRADFIPSNDGLWRGLDCLCTYQDVTMPHTERLAEVRQAVSCSTHSERLEDVSRQGGLQAAGSTSAGSSVMQRGQLSCGGCAAAPESAPLARWRAAWPITAFSTCATPGSSADAGSATSNESQWEEPASARTTQEQRSLHSSVPPSPDWCHAS